MENKKYIHKKLAAGRWFQLSFAEQMGNIGSEVGRACLAQNNNLVRFDGAVLRALDLFDLTLADERWRGRRFELARARELFCAASLGQDMYETSLADLERYFMQFAMAIALRRDAIFRNAK